MDGATALLPLAFSMWEINSSSLCGRCFTSSAQGGGVCSILRCLLLFSPHYSGASLTQHGWALWRRQGGGLLFSHRLEAASTVHQGDLHYTQDKMKACPSPWKSVTLVKEQVSKRCAEFGCAPLCVPCV